LARALQVDRFEVSYKKVGQLLKWSGFSLQSNRKTREGAHHPDRNAQFEHIAKRVVEAIRRWWYRLGKKRYENPRRILITADSGGSNSSRNRLWKLELQKFADETGMIIEVCHFPPGTSKWNKIEHRVFCHITWNWQGVPLETLEIIVELIGQTGTGTGLEVHCWLDEDRYDKGCKVTNAELDEVLIKPSGFHGEWNYENHPRHEGRIR
jgi:hypothetical protein